MSRNGIATSDSITSHRKGKNVLDAKDWKTVQEQLKLSRRQFEVLQHLFEDHTEAQIGIDLGISSHTAHTYVRQIYSRLNVRTRTELLIRVFAIVLARREQLAPSNASM